VVVLPSAGDAALDVAGAGVVEVQDELDVGVLRQVVRSAPRSGHAAAEDVVAAVADVVAQVAAVDIGNRPTYHMCRVTGHDRDFADRAGVTAGRTTDAPQELSR
jgi:hypothetical protein